MIFLSEVIVFCILLGIFSGVRTSSGETNSLGVMTLKTLFLSSPEPGTCIGGICVRDTCTRETYSEDTYTKIVSTSSTCIKGTYTGIASDKSTYVRSVYTVSCLEIHLQSFRILEIRGAR